LRFTDGLLTGGDPGGQGVPTQQVGFEWETQLTITITGCGSYLDQTHIEQGIVRQTVPIPTRMASWGGAQGNGSTAAIAAHQGQRRPGLSAMLPSRLWA